MSEHGMFARLRAGRRIWAIGAIHGDLDKIEALHDAVAPRLEAGDRIVYHGNYLGYGYDSVEVINELLRFRCWFLALPPLMHPDDLVFLRGAQEEMFQRLLQVQFAPRPQEVLEWMMQRGLESTLLSYGSDAAAAFKAADEGTMALTYWTSDLRERVRSQPGHDTFFSRLKRAAYVDAGAVLFVSAGVDVSRPLTAQSDAFWWAERSFAEIDKPYQGFQRIVRGRDPDAAGFRQTDYTISIDGGSGRGGTLIGVCLSSEGTVLETIEV